MLKIKFILTIYIKYLLNIKSYKILIIKIGKEAITKNYQVVIFLYCIIVMAYLIS